MENDLLNIYCPQCGAPAGFDIVSQSYRCGYCGGTVGLEDAISDKKQHQAELRQKVLKESVRYPMMTASCSGCGATIVFEENEAVSSCDFCGRKLVRKKYTQTNDVPEGIIPFALTPQEARERLDMWCQNNRHRKEAKLLSNLTEDLKGYYLPYNMTVGPVYCDVSKIHGGRAFTAGGYLRNEFINCSSQLDNQVLDAMEPYDLSGFREFDYAYVAGQRVKIADISAEESRKRLREEVTSNYRVFLEKIWGTPAIEISARVNAVIESPVLLPVYYINESCISAAVNGQTGKVSVREEKESFHISVPWWLKAIALFIASCVLTFGFISFSTGNIRGSFLLTGILAFFYFFIFCFMFDPGLDNTFGIIRCRNVLTSGEQVLRRKNGRLIPVDAILKRRIAEPVFSKEINGKTVRVTYEFRSASRVLGMMIFTLTAVFLPVIFALFINGFDFSRITLGGSAVWFCVAVPIAPIYMIQLGLKEFYNNPRIYAVTDNGRKKRIHDPEFTPKKVILAVLKFLFLNPLGWLAIAGFGVMVYLTAFGF